MADQPRPGPSQRTHIELVASVAREADLAAELVVRFLDRIGFLPPIEQRLRQPVSLPTEFLLELGATLRFSLWERSGVRDQIDPGLPPAEQTLNELLLRAADRPDSFSCEWTCPAPLLQRVLWAVIGRLAWAGRDELGADVVLDAADADGLIEELAGFLWDHRHLASEPE